MEYTLIFSRFAVGIMFFLSAFGKARDISAFRRGIIRFQILPQQLVQPFAYLMIASEFLIVFFVALGGSWLQTGFALAV